MLDSDKRRMIKNALIYLYQRQPDTIDYPVFYLSLPEKPAEDIGSTTKLLHSKNFIPWPYDNCVIFADEPISKLLFRPGNKYIDSILMFLVDKKLRDRYRRIPLAEHVDAFEHLVVYNVGLYKSKNSVFVVPSETTLFHVNDMVDFKMPDDPDALVEKHFKWISERVGPALWSSVPPDRLENYKKYLKNTFPTTRTFWGAAEIGDKDSLQIGKASDILSALSNLICPCHYVVKSIFSEGFGPSRDSFGEPSMKRRTKNKEIVSIIEYDRLYDKFLKDKETKEPSERHVQPHRRRGHPRYLWKLSGVLLDRIPANGDERALLALEKNVRTVYVSPAWIGPREFEEEEGRIRHQIMTEFLLREGKNANISQR